MADIILQFLTWAIPSGGIGAAIVWFFNRKAHKAEIAKTVHDTYKKMYEADEAPENRKVNADGKGWLSYEAKGLVFTKRFADLTPEQPAPGEAEIQVYVNQGKTYIEIENQGAYTALAPGEKLSWTVRWYLKPTE